MSLVTALLAFAAAAQPAPTPVPRGPVPADAPAWTFTESGCSARIPLAGGAALDLAFDPSRNQSYFSMLDPRWPRLRDGRSSAPP